MFYLQAAQRAQGQVAAQAPAGQAMTQASNLNQNLHSSLPGAQSQPAVQTRSQSLHQVNPSKCFICLAWVYNQCQGVLLL